MTRLCRFTLSFILITSLCGFFPPPVQRHGPVAQRIFNFIHDAGATCNGVADDGPALANAGVVMRAAQAAAPTLPVTLLIPPGVTCNWQSCPISADGQQRPFALLKNFTLVATGATITGFGCTVFSGDVIPGIGDQTVVQHRFNANSVNDSCVTMVNPGDEAGYPVGRWVLVSGEGMQVNSFPPNYSMWEYAQVSSTGGGKVCLTAGLRNAYPDNTVVVDLGLLGNGQGVNANCSNVTCGGQGALILLSASWDTVFHFIGGNWQPTNQMEWSARTVIMDNMSWTAPGFSQNCWLPTLIQTVLYINNNTGTCTAEMDKEVDQIIVDGGTLRGNFQSQSINTMILSNGATYLGPNFPLHTKCNDSTIDVGAVLKFGNAFGSLPITFDGVNCNLPRGISTSPNVFNAVQILPNSGAGSSTFFYNGSSQIQRNPVNIYGGMPQWMSRNGHLLMACQLSGSCAGNGTDYGSHVTITGSQYSPIGSTSGTLVANITPSLGIASGHAPPPDSGTIDYNANNFPTVTCSGCLGSSFALNLNNAGAQNQPAFTYYNATYTCVNNIANVPGSFDINGGGSGDHFTMLGRLVSLKVNVTVADTNPADSGANILLSSRPPFNTFNTSTGVESGGVQIAQVDILHTGLRTITLTTTSGAAGNDVLTAPGANFWLQGPDNNIVTTPINNFVTNGPAGQCPVVNVEWITSD